ncbi:Patronin [Nymphon striatum]|nr:Patronin [Nymphon striatum]
MNKILICIDNRHLMNICVLPFAKQQASVLWLLSKSYGNDIPSNLLEPYYRDHEGQDQLKPQIVHALANAELYCLALGFIYADQNYHSLNHNGVMMLLQRKGVYVVEPADVSLTETVLVQVAPLRMTAHMAVIEAIMALYIKEVLIPDKIVECLKKFTKLTSGTELPVDPEDAVVLWINKSCDKMKAKIQEENDLNCSSESDTAKICLNETLSLADSLYNLQLILKFCESVLPFNFYFLSLEDVLYMHSSIRQNFLAFLADIFYNLEIKPAKCVRSPGHKDHKIHIPDDSESVITSIMPAAGIRSGFKRVDDTLIPARLKVSKEKIVKESKKEERGESPEKPKQTGIIGEADVVLTSITGSPRRTVPNNAPLASNLVGIPGFQSPCADTPDRKFVVPSPHSEYGSDNKVSSNYAEISKVSDLNVESGNNLSPQKSSFAKKESEKLDSPKPVKKTSFASMPSNTTTWQQQFKNSQIEAEQLSSSDENDVILTSQLNNIKLELEEKRRNIELEKKKLELMWNDQRQKFGKAAFLQALNKNVDKEKTENYAGSDNKENGPQTEIEKEVNSSQEKWSKNKEDGMKEDINSFQTQRPIQKDLKNSIGQLNESLNDLQVDLSKLSKQQDMIQKIVHYQPKEEPKDQQQNFYLHNQQVSSAPSNFSPNPMNVQNSHAPIHQNVPTRQPPNPESHMQINQPQMMMPHGAGPMDHHSLPPQMMHQQDHSPSQYQQHQQHQRAQWNVPAVTQDLSIAAPRRAQWTQPNPQSMIDAGHQQRQQWYLPQQSNAPIMSTGQYPMPYNPNYIGQDQPSRQYPMYQNGQMENPHYPYSSPYPPAQSSIHLKPMQFHLHDQPNQSAPMNIQSNDPGQQNMRPPVSSATASNQPAPVHSNHVPVRKDPSQSDVPNIDNKKDQHQLTLNNVPCEINNSEPEESISPRADKHTLGKTFRVPKPRVKSPTAKQAVLPPNDSEEEMISDLSTQPIKDGADADLGFFVSFENEQPVKPRPKLRGKPGLSKTSQPSKDSSPRMDNPFRKKEDGIPQNFDNPFRKNYSKEDNSQQNLNNPFRRNINVADKSSPLHHINDPNIESARSSSSSVPDVSSPIPRNDSRSSCNVDQDEEEEDNEMNAGVGFIIGADLVNPDPIAEDEMQKRKERIMMISLHRKAEQEAKRLSKERENAMQREEKRIEKEKLDQKKEEEKMRRQMIFEQYKQRKHAEAEESEGRTPELPSSTNASRTFTKPRPRSSKQRPKSQFYNSNTNNHNYPPPSIMSSRGSMRGSQPNLSGFGENSCNDETDSQTLMRRALSPPPGIRQPSDPRLPGGYYGRPGPPSEASDTCSTGSALDYCGPRLFVKPASKSNRGIVINAVGTVLAGHVNADSKSLVLDEINKCESKHFLILFRDQSLKFRGLYSYHPEREEIFKLCGAGPKQVTDKMMDKYFKYNCGAKTFSAIHTKHLTVTIDAITIHNSLWQGKTMKKTQPRRDYV